MSDSSRKRNRWHRIFHAALLQAETQARHVPRGAARTRLAVLWRW